MTVTTPYGGGSGLLDKLDLLANGEPSKEKLTVKCAGTDFASTDTHIAAILTNVNSVLTAGHATSQALALSYNPASVVGGGQCFVKSVKITAPKDVCKVELGIQGTGAFS